MKEEDAELWNRLVEMSYGIDWSRWPTKLATATSQL